MAIATSTLARPTRVRHLVLAMTIAAYMITYMDRVVISSAAPVIKKNSASRWSPWAGFCSFRWGYSLFQIPGGWLGDRIGPRRALTLIVSWWSVFTSLTAPGLGCGFPGLIRFLFGVGRSRSVPDRHTLALALDAARRARHGPGHYSRRFASRRGADSAAGGR